MTASVTPSSDCPSISSYSQPYLAVSCSMEAYCSMAASRSMEALIRFTS